MVHDFVHELNQRYDQVKRRERQELDVRTLREAHLAVDDDVRDVGEHSKEVDGAADGEVVHDHEDVQDCVADERCHGWWDVCPVGRAHCRVEVSLSGVLSGSTEEGVMPHCKYRQ